MLFLGVYSRHESNAKHRFRESRLELDAKWRLETASPVLNTLFRGLCKNPHILMFSQTKQALEAFDTLSRLDVLGEGG